MREERGAFFISTNSAQVLPFDFEILINTLVLEEEIIGCRKWDHF